MDAGGRDAFGSGDGVDELLDLESLALDLVEVIAVDFHADLGANASVKHEDAVFDRLEERGDVAGDFLHFLGQFGAEFLHGHAFAPFGIAFHAEPAVLHILGLEHDGGFQHFGRGGVGRGLEAAELSGDNFDFR